MGVTTVSALLCRISGSAQVPFDGLLRGLCDILAARFGRSGGPRLACVAADEALPIGAVTLFGLIADLLITNAFLYAFPPGGGGIAVSFAAGQEAWLLTVEDGGIAMRAPDSRRQNGLTIARLLVVRVGGRLKIPIVTGGTRYIVTIPRPMRASTSASHVASVPWAAPDSSPIGRPYLSPTNDNHLLPRALSKGATTWPRWCRSLRPCHRPSYHKGSVPRFHRKSVELLGPTRARLLELCG